MNRYDMDLVDLVNQSTLTSDSAIQYVFNMKHLIDLIIPVPLCHCHPLPSRSDRCAALLCVVSGLPGSSKGRTVELQCLISRLVS
jgi:hypothetical protein